MKNMKKLLVLLSTTAVGSTGTLSLMTNQNIGSSITNIKTYSSSTYATINKIVAQLLNISDANGVGTKEIGIEFIKDVAQYKINTTNISLTNLVSKVGKALNSESAMFLSSELKINAVDDIFDYDYLKSVKIQISNIKCDVVHEYYDDKDHFTVENGTYILNFIDNNGTTLGTDYQIEAKAGTDAYFGMIDGNADFPGTYENLVYPGSPIETFRPYAKKAKLKEWLQTEIDVPLIHGTGTQVPSSVKKFLSYQELIGWQVSFRVKDANVSSWEPVRFQPGDILYLSINFMKDKDLLVYPKVIKLTLTDDFSK